ncbi:MAG: hypothetical protein AAGH73_11265, partial [Pseudomonadota bacterium]
MFKDDRMISILSGIVLMLAIGTLVQRQDLVSSLMGDDAEDLALNDDQLSVAPDTLTRVDVLANDTGVGASDGARLSVLSQPNCGRVFVQNGALQFLAEQDCGATQTFQYALDGEDALAPGTVTVSVRGATGIRNAPEPSVGGSIALDAPRAPG